MVADFRSRNVDLNKVSKAVKQFVENVAKTEGNKKKIDTDNEFNQLSLYLSGAGKGMNKDEINYIQGFMFEYQNKKFEEFEENCVTANTKKEVSKIAKRMGDKKNIDTDEEAQALATMLRNSHNELNDADISYIKSLLIRSGYFQYLQEKEPSVTVVNVIVNEEKTAKIQKSEEKPTENQVNADKVDSTEPKYNYPVNKKSSPQKPIYKEKSKAKGEVLRAKIEADRSKAEADRSEKEANRSKAEADRSEAEADRAKKEADKILNAPKVKEASRAQGFGIASKIQEELHDTWTDNGLIKEEISRVNSSNAYSFVGKMLEVTDSHTVFGNIYKRITANDVQHVVVALLAQAKNIGLQTDPAYKTLLDTYRFIKRQYVDKNPTDSISDRRDIEQLNIHIKRLYNTMSKVYK